MRATLVPVMRDSWTFKVLAFFSRDAFWVWQITQRFWDDLFEGRFEECGQRIYERHFERLEVLLKADGRQWLNWVPEDGWEPLCGFLEMEVPEGAFQRSNGVEEFYESLSRRSEVHFWSAVAWMVLAFGVGVMAVGIGLMRIVGV